MSMTQGRRGPGSTSSSACDASEENMSVVMFESGETAPGPRLQLDTGSPAAGVLEAQCDGHSCDGSHDAGGGSSNGSGTPRHYALDVQQVVHFSQLLITSFIEKGGPPPAPSSRTAAQVCHPRSVVFMSYRHCSIRNAVSPQASMRHVTHTHQLSCMLLLKVWPLRPQVR